MRKYFLSFVALAGMLFATSCQESLVEPQVGGPTTFTVQLPDAMGTKANGDSYKLFVEVYSADGLTKIHRLEDAITVGTPKTVSLNLVATQVYDIIFWAQKDGASYNVNDLNKVEITNQHHNSENGAAFYAIKNDYKPVEVNNPSVTLTRPFAQLNIGTIDEVSYGDNNGNKKIEILSTNIKVESAAKYFERINTQESPELGEGRTGVVFEYTGGEVLNSTMTIGEGANAKTYKQVSMDYISVLGNKDAVTVTATIEVRDPNGVESTIERVITNVPLQMNYRTNIVGNLITSASDFTIEISEAWGGTNDKEVVFREVATAAELQDAINDGVDNITLTDDITVNSTLVFKAVPSQSNIGRASADVAEFVLDLNGKDLSYAVQNNVGASAIINIHSNAKLSIVGNGTISFVSQNPDTQEIPSYATNTITNEGYLVIGEGVVVINESEGGASYAVDDKGKFVLNGGTLIGERCALRIAKYNQDNVYFEMNGGMVTAKTPAWIQLPGSNANSAPTIDVVINNGTFQSTNSTSAENDLLYTYSFGNSHANTTLTINGGNFIGGTVSIGAGYKGDYPTININGGAFDYDVVRWLEDDASEVIYSANPTTVYITDPAQLTKDVIENNETIYLAAGEYTINLYDIAPKSTSLTIVGTEGTKVKFANQQVRLALFKKFTIKNCEILHMATKSWGMLVFSSGNKADGVYTIENCTFNGVGTQGIYINEEITGATYNIKNCTFNGDFGGEGAITIQTNKDVYHTVNVEDCEFNNIPATSHRIFLAPYDGRDGLFYDFTLNTDLKATTAYELEMFLALGQENVVVANDIYSEAATIAPYGNKYGYKMDGGILDGNGHKLDIECYGDDYGIMTSGGTIKNLTIENGTRAVMIMYVKDDVILDNVRLGGEGVLYPINTGEAGDASQTAKLIVSNSTLAGWTSYSNISSASFTNVEFKQGTYYNNIYGRVLKPYVNTTLTNCSFIAHMNLDLSSLTEGHKIVIENCTVNGQLIAADVFTVPSCDNDYDTKLFTVDLPSWATNISDCIEVK